MKPFSNIANFGENNTFMTFKIEKLKNVWNKVWIR